MKSIERTLLAWILGALALGAVLVALVTYLVTLEEMNEVFDNDLQNVARAMASYHHSALGPRSPGEVVLQDRSDEPDDSEIVTLTWTPTGQRLYASDPRVRVPFSRTEGLSRPMVDGEPWIVYSSVSEVGTAQAAQRNASRQEMARESAVEVLLPLAGLVAAVGGLLVLGLRGGFRSLDVAARDIASRSARTLDAIELGGVPKEVAPIVASINGLMERLGLAFTAQRRFLADAAHELRTPMTALRLQLQLLERASDEGERRASMAALAAGIDRSQHLIEQLLQVARTEPDGEPVRHETVDLAGLARTVVASFSAKADHAGLDFGASAPDSVRVQGDAAQLTVLLNNLVENALRYTPAGGVVDVAVSTEQGHARLRVSDSGPGIPEAERERVFDRFYRCEDAQAQSRDGSGSGLGLAIVKSIADRHGASVTLATAPSGRGLEVRVAFA
ncbi:MAG: two-component sensor histidine kinase [Rubrivivax sp.]|nr:MAG: two-component sensor histidine kinase [Rubrivivax sp.]